jgi:uncharacterized membrane protein
MSGILVLYPVIIFLCFNVFKVDVRHVSIVVIVFALFFLFVNRRHFQGNGKKMMLVCPFILLLLGSVCFFIREKVLYYIYPALADFTYFIVFFLSFFAPPPVVYQIVSLVDKKVTKWVPPSVVRAWSWRMTAMWCVFFMVDAAIALITFYWLRTGYHFFRVDPHKIWGMYNAFFSYVAMGVIIASQVVDFFMMCKRHGKNPAFIDRGDADILETPERPEEVRDAR